MGFFSGSGGFFDSIRDVDWGETADTISETAQDVGRTIDAFDGGGDPTIPPGTPPFGGPRPPLRRDPLPPRRDPQPQPDPDPQEAEAGPMAFLGSAGGLAVLGIIGAIIATR